MSNGKGDKPRNCFSTDFKDNYDQIDWSKRYYYTVEMETPKSIHGTTYNLTQQEADEIKKANEETYKVKLIFRRFDSDEQAERYIKHVEREETLKIKFPVESLPKRRPQVSSVPEYVEP